MNTTKLTIEELLGMDSMPSIYLPDCRITDLVEVDPSEPLYGRSVCENNYENDYEYDNENIYVNEYKIYTRSICEAEPGELDPADARFGKLLSMKSNDEYFTPTAELEALDAKLEEQYDIVEDEDIESHDLHKCSCCYNSDWRYIRAYEFKDFRRFTNKTRFNETIVNNYDCDCDVCTADDDIEVNSFNELHDTHFPLSEFEKLNLYAKFTQLSLKDACCYAQSCHYCNESLGQGDDSLFGMMYCSEECEIEVEVFDKECSNKDCKICENPNKIAAFNKRYGNVNFDKEDIQLIKDYAKRKNANVTEAISYMSTCHHCGEDIPFNCEYCTEVCREQSCYFQKECFRGEDCKICDNYVIQQLRDIKQNPYF